MHILAPQAGRIDDGEDAIDLGQTPGDIVILSAADSELSALSASQPLRRSQDQSLRLVNLMQLTHPYSVDLYVDRTARHAKLIIVRILGGVEYWRYGVEQLQRLSRGYDIKLYIMPGDDKWDESLAAHSSEPVADVRRVWRYFVEGGQENLIHLLDFASARLAEDGDPEEVPYPLPLPRMGIFDQGKSHSGEDGLEAWLAETDKEAGRPSVPILFYRSYVQSAMTAPIDALCQSLRDNGLRPIPLFVPSLKDSAAQEFLGQVFSTLLPSVFLNCTAFALSKVGGKPEPTFLDAYDCPVLQVMLSGSSRQAWEESPRGLSARDLAMHVVLPELDGRILSRAIAFKEEGTLDEATEYRPVSLVPHGDRVAFVAAQAAAWAKIEGNSSKRSQAGRGSCQLSQQG